MLTRSHPFKNFVSLPVKERIIIISISDLYSSLNNDLISLVYDERHAQDPKFQSMRISNIKKNIKIYNEFYCFVASKIKNRYIHLNQSFNDYYLEQEYLYIQKIFFLNQKSHVRGAIDGLMHSDLLLSLFGFEELPGYYIVYFEPDKWTSYHEYKSIALLNYFPAHAQIYKTKILLINRHFLARWLPMNQDKLKDIKDRICQIRRVKRYSEFVDLSKISDQKYMPNMKLDNLWLSCKKKISFQLGEITELWCCDDSHRQIAFKNKVYSWRDKEFSPFLIKWSDPQKIQILEKILATNRQDPQDDDFQWIKIDADLITKYPLLGEEDCNDIFVDFEYTMDYLYLIGIFHNDKYIRFWADDLSIPSEKKIIIAFSDFLREHESSRVWYWHAEKNKWRSVCFRHDLFEIGSMTNKWTDLCHLMRSGTATVYKSLDFKLKSIVNAFFYHDKIPFSFQDLEECTDGKSSIDIAIRYYKDMNEHDRRSIEKYNQMDCESMKYILKEIKNNIIYK
jgi:hypothetical protein